MAPEDPWALLVSARPRSRGSRCSGAGLVVSRARHPSRAKASAVAPRPVQKERVRGSCRPLVNGTIVREQARSIQASASVYGRNSAFAWTSLCGGLPADGVKDARNAVGTTR